jgi:glycosyltransferase involved in cell wall biosynthesis
MNKPSLSIVVPVFNSQETLPALLDRLHLVLSAAGSTYEVLLVNDGSYDRSWEVVCKFAARHSWIRGIDLSRNYGQHNALLCGIRSCKNDVVVTLDDDLQNPPEEIPKLLSKLTEGYDVVYGKPDQERHGLFRDLASKCTKMALQKAMGAATAGQVSAFRAFRGKLRDSFANYAGPYVSIDVLLTWSTAKFASITVEHQPRSVGKSNYGFRKLIIHAMNMITGFSEAPLRLASGLGFLFMIFGFSLAIFVLARFFIEGGSVPGFAFLASSITIFSGIQLFTLGIFGEYLARIHFRLMGRPTYIIRQESEPHPDETRRAG